MRQASKSVALRSADSEVIEAVREIVSLIDAPLSIYPPGSEPVSAALLLDSYVELRRGDPWWVDSSHRASWVGVRPPESELLGRLIRLPQQAEELLAMTRVALEPRRARVIAVTGARGGVGASVFAASLARSGAEGGLASALVDLDTAGPGIDLLLGIEEDGGMRWADLDLDPGSLSGTALSESLPMWHGVHVLSGDWRGCQLAATMPAVTALASNHDLVVIDVPRTSTHWAMQADETLIVATCDVVAAEAARTTAAAWASSPARLVVRGPSIGGLSATQIAEAAGIDLALTMRSERGLRAGIERGVAPGDNRRGALRRGTRRMVEGLDSAA